MVDIQPGKYSSGADDIIALKNAGVSEKVITTMHRGTVAGQLTPVPRSVAKDSIQKTFGARGRHELLVRPEARPVAGGDREKRSEFQEQFAGRQVAKATAVHTLAHDVCEVLENCRQL